MILHNSILLNKQIMMAITREDDFVSRAAGEWRYSPERVMPLSANRITILFSRL
jgi:hypothetical protein